MHSTTAISGTVCTPEKLARLHETKMKNEERDKIMKEVSEHVNSHPECKTVKTTEETTETATELTPPE